MVRDGMNESAAVLFSFSNVPPLLKGWTSSEPYLWVKFSFSPNLANTTYSKDNIFVFSLRFQFADNTEGIVFVAEILQSLLKLYPQIKNLLVIDVLGF